MEVMKDLINPKKRYTEDDLVTCTGEIRSLRLKIHKASEVKNSIISRGEVPTDGLENQIALLKIRLNDNLDRQEIIRRKLSQKRSVNMENNNG